VRVLRPLDEAECYARCYGSGDGTVRVIRREARPAAPPAVVRLVPTGNGGNGRLSGEDLRQLFEQRLNAREPSAV